jgi:hypothetical protein
MSIRRITTADGKIPYDLIDGAPSANPPLATVLTNGNTTGGIDILGSSSNIETDALKCVSIRPLAFPIETNIIIDGNLAMEDNTNINFGTDIDIQIDNQQVLYTDGSTNVIFSNVPKSATAPSANEDLTNKQYVDSQIGSAGIVDSIVAGSGISVNSADPINPIVSNTGVLELTQGDNISITGSKSNYTINALLPPTPSLAQVMDISSVASQNLIMNTKNITGFTDLSGTNGYFDNLFAQPMTDAQIGLNHVVVGSQANIANTYYINDNVTDIQTVYNAHSAEQGVVYKISSGSYGGSTLIINNSSNILFDCPNPGNGSTITELASGRGLTISNSSRIRFNGLQIEGTFKIGGNFAGPPSVNTNCIFSNCEFLGTIEIGYELGAVNGFITFYNCTFATPFQYNLGSATIYCINCNFSNQAITNNGLPTRLIITNGAGLNSLAQTNYIAYGQIVNSSGVSYNVQNVLATPGNFGNITSSQIEVASDPATSNALTRKSYVDAQVATKVGSVVGGTAITIGGTSTSPIINNAGVTSLTAGTNITLSGSTGAITISASGGGGTVTSVSAGTGISITGTSSDPIVSNTGIISITAGTGLSSTQVTPGNPTLNNEGVLELTAGSNITITGTKSNYTISSTGGGGGGNQENVALLNSTTSLTELGALALPLSSSSYTYQIEDTNFGDARVSINSIGQIVVLGGGTSGNRTFSIQLQFRLDTNAPSSSAGPITFFLVDISGQEKFFCGEFDPQAFLSAKQIFFYNEIFTLTIPYSVSDKYYTLYIKDDVSKWQNGGNITQWTITNSKILIWYYGQIGFNANVPSAIDQPITVAPTITSITATGANTIELNWSAVSGADNYYIYRSLDDSTYTLIYVISSIYNTYTDTGLDPETTYYYKIGAENEEGVGPLSASANATTETSDAPTFSDYWTDARAPYTDFGGSFIHPSSDAIINSAVMTKLGSGPTAIYMIRRQDGGSWEEGTQHSPVTIKTGFTGAGGPLIGEYSTRASMLAVGGGCTWDSDIAGVTWNIGQTKIPYNLPYNVTTNPYGYSNWP